MYWSVNNLTRVALLITSSFVVGSCKNESTSAILYPIDSLVTSQVKFLSSTRAKLTKKAVIAEKADEITYTPKDTAEWLNELAVFQQLDIINKTINFENYAVEDKIMDQGSNLTVKVLSTEKKLPVKYLKIYYQKNDAEPRRIEALYREESALSKTGRLLVMEFQQYNNKNVLTSYSIEGGQKMIFGDTVAFVVEGKIKLD